MARLNQELARRGANPVSKEELPEIDTLLDKSLAEGGARAGRCWRCDGYIGPDVEGEQTCLNCGRPAGPNKQLAEVVESIAQCLIERRAAEADAQKA
ncbi:MAG: hypothetical protein U1B78_01305 [Dehalococcoidia bacterium]|nr:hypothetical protein [Dehalococcoidia bacterium]